jgi:hypothetical protein
MNTTPLPGFECHDCGQNTHEIGEYYMVQFALWKQVAPDCQDGILCIGCLEARLGRTLTPADFTDCAVNCNIYGNMSARILDRIGNTAEREARILGPTT